MPPKKAKKPKKPALQKQKQKQSQQVVVNVNQQSKRKAPARRRAPPRQQTQLPVQQIVLTGGAGPLPITFNPSPVQSTQGFNAPPTRASLGTPIDLNEPVALPTFAEEPVLVIGDENVSVPVPSPVSAPEPIVVPSPIIIEPSRPPVSIPDSRFISQPPTPPQSISSLFSDISKETGITSKSVADFLFKKKKTDPKAPARIDNEPLFFTKEDLSVAGAPASLPTISTRPSFYEPSVKGGEFRNAPIIVPPKEVIEFKKPEPKRSEPFNIFSDNETGRSIASEKSLIVIPKMEAKPPKKRLIIEEENPKKRLPMEPTVKYQSKADLQAIAKDKKINLLRPNGKDKTRNELRLEIYSQP